MRQAPDKAPAGLGFEARELWSSVVDVFDLEEHERVLLVEACRTVDLLQKLDTEVRRDGPTIDSQGLRAHPAATEARQQRIALARLLAVLRLPAGEDGDQQAGARPPPGRGAWHVRHPRGRVVSRREIPEEMDHQPPPELLRFRPSQPAPIGPYGRPEPWRVVWDAEEFAAFLRAREAWRDTHVEPLPLLPPKERVAMVRLGIPQVLIDSERRALEKERAR